MCHLFHGSLIHFSTNNVEISMIYFRVILFQFYFLSLSIILFEISLSRNNSNRSWITSWAPKKSSMENRIASIAKSGWNLSGKSRIEISGRHTEVWWTSNLLFSHLNRTQGAKAQKQPVKYCQSHEWAIALRCNRTFDGCVNSKIAESTIKLTANLKISLELWSRKLRLYMYWIVSPLSSAALPSSSFARYEHRVRYEHEFGSQTANRSGSKCEINDRIKKAAPILQIII